MTPGARVQAAMDLVLAIDTAGNRPADGVVKAFFRDRRYMGAKDRRAVSLLVYGVLRRRARLDWWVRHSLSRVQSSRRGGKGWSEPAPGSDPVRDARRRVFASLVLVDGQGVDRLATLSGDAYGPPGLSQDERDMLAGMARQSLLHSAMPRWVRLEVPEWLEPRLAERFGDGLAAELAALDAEAPLDLRTNTLKGTREDAIARLQAEGVEDIRPTPFSPLGLRLTARVDVARGKAFRDGLIEVQDEGSQIVTLLTGARPGEAVIDYCAGAGGKALALAAAMANKGRLMACDVSAGRLERSAVRLRRADVHNVTCRVLEPGHDPWVRRSRGRFDRVLVDAPCSGTGTWRRNPDARWRLTPEGIAELVALQAEILATASRLVRPGGRLVYATCSLLAEENEDQIARFLATTDGFRALSPADVWAAAAGSPWPFEAATGTDATTAVPSLTLTPARHGTDGYFIAVLERTAAEQTAAGPAVQADDAPTPPAGNVG